MSLTKQEERQVIWKLRRADDGQVRRFKDELGSYRAANELFERFKEKHEVACPDCGSIDDKNKYGKTPQGKQRWRCKACDRTFIAEHSMPFYRSQRTVEEWKSFFVSMLNGATLEELSKAYDMSIKTAFKWRHKLLRTIRELQQGTCLAGRVWADETFLNKNEPGRDREGGVGDIAILTAQDYKGRTMLVPTGPDGMSKTRAIKQTFERYVFEENSTLVTDEAPNFIEYGEKSEVAHETYDPSSDDMNMINWLHSHFKTWYKQFRGVGSKYLRNYCSWFAFLKNHPNLRSLTLN